MSIAINTAPIGAIATITDLVDEVRDEMDDDAFPAAKIYKAIARVEAEFNRTLRTPQMETNTLLSITQETTDLPGDFLQMRTIYQEGQPDSPLKSMSPAGLRGQFMGRAGIPCAYAIENRRIMIGPVGETSIDMTYYQRIPALTESTPNNWLLDSSPDLYLHSVLAVLFNRQDDTDRSNRNQAIASSIMDSLMTSAKSARWGAGPLVPSGMKQVYGARA